MAEKKKTSSSSSNTKPKRTWSSTKILDCVAYFAIIFIAIALIFRLAFKEHAPEVSGAFASIGECLAYIVCIWLGFYWVMRKNYNGWNKHNVWWLICWIVATVVIIVVYIFALI